MAKPVSAPTIFASSATFTGASNVPAGLVGQPVRVTGPSTFFDFGFQPNETFKSQFANAVIGPLTEWARWVYDGTSTAAATAHIVETVSSGRANIRLVHIGASPVEPYFPAAMLEVETEVGYRGVTITTVATSLHALKIDAASTGSPAMLITQTGAGMPALDITGPGGVGVATILVNSSSGIGVKATVTGANGSAIEGYTTAGSTAGVYGEGAAIGVRGVCTATNGAGGRFDTNGSAGSTSEAIDARAYADGVGVRVASVDNNAINVSCTGEEDAIVVLAAGDGAALRMDAQGLPTVERVGQLWVESINSDPNRVTYKVMTNDTGLVGTGGSHLWNGAAPLIADYDTDAGPTNIAEAATGTLNTLVVENPYGFTVRVWVTAEFTATIGAVGSIPLDSAFSVFLRDNTAGTNFYTDTVSMWSASSIQRFVFSDYYDLPAATTTTLLVRLTVSNGGGAGDMDFTNCSVAIRTASGGAR